MEGRNQKLRLERIWSVPLIVLLLYSHLSADEELMKKYEPFLFFHDDETYREVFYPMDIADYVNKCSLWYDDAEKDYRHENGEVGEVNLETLANLGRTLKGSENLYLKFVEDREASSLMTDKFGWEYFQDALNEYINASSKYTYYFRQFTEPDYGYLVLQYWFFYAFNSWGTYPFGFNIHEGDWECVMLFLHPETQYPVYVAYSAHHAEGDKVRRDWSKVSKTGTYPHVFVALGSHANYLESKFDIVAELIASELSFSDRANGQGMLIGPFKITGTSDFESKEWENRVILEDETHSLPGWARYYDGKWGMDAILGKVGFDGPRFPPFQSNSDKWYHPAKWAGIQEGPSEIEPTLPMAAKIVIEGADTVWETELTRSEDLVSLSQTVEPRIIVEYADYSSDWELAGSAELKDVARSVSPRVIIEYADSCFSHDLQKSETLENLATTVPPRIIIEYADSSFFRNLIRYAQGGVLERILGITSTEGQPGTSTTVQIVISETLGVTGGDILIKYDANVLTIDEVNGTDLLTGINPIVNMNIPGQVAIGMAGTHGLPSGSGALLDIELTVSADAQPGTQTLLTFGDSKIYDESGAVIPVSLENGVVKIIEPVGIKGDVSKDGKVASNDAILTLRIATGLIEPTDYQKWAADMNGDGKVASNDAILILRAAAGLAAPGKDIIASIGAAITISLAEVHGVAGESVIVPVKVDNAGRLAGGDICIAYDRSVLRAVNVVCDSDILLVKNIDEFGKMRIAFASSNRLSDNTLAKIHFDILSDDVSLLRFEAADLYQPDASPIKSKTLDGKFVSWAVPPKHSALLQNFPNPFNPDTWIPYQLKESGEVAIQIFSIPGEVIREIKLGYKPAGLYVTRDRAAYWDGRNEAGEKAASGIYFYTIKAGEFIAIKKMILMK